jgi:hypothetical protein
MTPFQKTEGENLGNTRYLGLQIFFHKLPLALIYLLVQEPKRHMLRSWRLGIPRDDSASEVALCPQQPRRRGSTRYNQ